MKMLQRGLAHSTKTGPSVQAKDASGGEDWAQQRVDGAGPRGRISRPAKTYIFPPDDALAKRQRTISVTVLEGLQTRRVSHYD